MEKGISVNICIKQVTTAKRFLTNLRQTIQHITFFLPATFKKESDYLILDINFTVPCYSIKYLYPE